MRRALVVFAVIGCSVLASGVSIRIAAPSVGAAEPLVMTVGTVGSIGSLDPRTGNSVVAREVWKIQYPTLTAVDPRTLGFALTAGPFNIRGFGSTTSMLPTGST